MYLSVIIPARNEESNIRGTIESIYSYLLNRGISHEILVMENNSTDRTVEIVKSMTNNIPTLSLTTLVIKGSQAAKGYAVREGILKAKGDFRLFMDADNATTIDHIERMMPYFEQGYGVVIGSIAVKGKVIAGGSEPAWRRLFGKMGNLFIQIMAVPGIMIPKEDSRYFLQRLPRIYFPRSLFMDGVLILKFWLWRLNMVTK